MARKYPTVLLPIAAGLTLIVGIGAYVLLSGQIPRLDQPANSRELTATLAAGKSLGLPQHASELTNTAISLDQNAAAALIPLLSSVAVPKSDGGFFLTATKDPEKVSIAKAELAEVSKTLDAIVVAVKRPNWAFHRDWDQSVLLLFPEYGKIKAATKLLASRSLQKALKGDREGALSDFRAARQLIAHVSTDPTIFATLIAIAGDAIALRGAENLTHVWAKDDASLEALAKAIEETNFLIDPRTAWRGEYFMAVAFSRNYDALGGYRTLLDATTGPTMTRPSAEEWIREGEPTSTEARAMLNAIASLWNGAFEKFGKDRPKAGTWGKYFQDQTALAEKSGSASQKMANVLIPALGQVDLALVKQEMLPSQNIALIRALQFRNRTGAFPKDLAELKLNLPDPFAGGAQMSYLLKDGVVQIYSVGPDKSDDGGPLLFQPNRRDIGVVYPTTARRRTSEKSNGAS